MAYTGTVCTAAEQQFYAGENLDAQGNVEANHNILIAQAEAYLCALVDYDIVTNWASLSTVTRAIFTEYAARFCAVGLVAFNMHGYGTEEAEGRIHGEDLINIHFARMTEIKETLEKLDIKHFLGVN